MLFLGIILVIGFVQIKCQEGVCALSEQGTCLNSINPKGANTEGKPRAAVKECLDRHEQCTGFSIRGECIKNPGWMIMNCPKSCDLQTNACELRDPLLRCPRSALNMSNVPAYAPGDMHNMFKSIKTKFGDTYDINILSETPWVVTFDNFLTNAEVDALITTVDKWERSTDTGSTNEYGEAGRILSSGRTSSNSWCRDRCEQVNYSTLL